MKGDRKMYEAIAFFGVGFILCVGGIYAYLKSDETAFIKAMVSLEQFKSDVQTSLKGFRGEVDEWTKNMSELQSLCTKGFDQAASRDTELYNKLGAMELEVENLKKKQALIHEKMVPSNTRLRLKVDGPIPVEIYQRPKASVSIPSESLLQKAGIKKKTK